MPQPPSPSDDHLSPDDLELRSRRDWAVDLNRALGQLDPLARQLITRTYFGGRTQVQLTADLALSASTVKATFAEGVRELALLLLREPRRPRTGG
jgi:DNA-directed RNA polymerase specialized sigma24 family protein